MMDTPENVVPPAIWVCFRPVKVAHNINCHTIFSRGLKPRLMEKGWAREWSSETFMSLPSKESLSETEPRDEVSPLGRGSKIPVKPPWITGTPLRDAMPGQTVGAPKHAAWHGAGMEDQQK